MSSSAGRPRSKSGGLHRFFHRRHNSTSSRASGPSAPTIIIQSPPVAQTVSAPAPLQSTSPCPPDPAKIFLEKALESLPDPKDREIINQYLIQTSGINAAVDACYNAAERQKDVCESKQWKWRTWILRDEVDKVLRLLDRVKSVGDITANVNAITVGLPWAGVRLLLEAAMADSNQMGSLVTGLGLVLYMVGRLKVYFVFFQRLRPSPATSQFETALVKIYTHILDFLATAIKTYNFSTFRRISTAIWESASLDTFDSKCNELATSAETEASNCDRELAALGHEDDAKRWKQTRDDALQILAAIQRVGEDVARLNAKFDLVSVLSNLHPVVSAIHSTYGANSTGCLVGTRTQLIRDITMWADDPHGKPIFWLCGKAGTGKSAVSVTMAKQFKDQHRLGASFLFKRSENDRKDAQLFFTTIASQLVHLIPGIGRSMAAALQNNPNLSTESLQEQFDKLIFDPLRTLSQDQFPSARIVIIIDALDECASKDQIKIIVSLLKRLANSFLRLRMFVTSRPEAQYGFSGIEQMLHHDVHLEVLQAETIKPDLETYFLDCFAKIKADQLDQRLPRPLPADWPSADDIKSLVDLASPLFIYATTVYLYLSHPSQKSLASPRNITLEDRLEILLRQRNRLRLGELGELDKLYLPILDQMAAKVDRGQDAAIYDFKNVVGPIVVLADPLSVNALAALLGLQAGDVAYTLAPLYSLLALPPDLAKDRDVPVRPLHLSFHDFLVDDKIEKNRFWIDEVKIHGQLARQCLELLCRREGDKVYLKYDICSVQRPGAQRASIGLDEVGKYIPTEAAYACRHWVLHLAQSQEKIGDDGQVFDFLKQHFLHWIEAVTWLGKVSNVIADLNTLESLVEDDTGSQLLAFLRDAQRFMLQNRYIVDIAPLQLYSSALIFTPTKSIVRKTFGRLHSDQWPLSSIMVPAAWSSEIQKLEGHDGRVRAVAFSSDGQVLASASADKTVRLWNTTTGEAMHTLTGHADNVSAVVFSPTVHVLASASYDNTVRFWDAMTGEMIHILEDHDNGVNAIAFSPNGLVLASASDNKVRFWDATTYEEISPLNNHDSLVGDIAFSIDGQMLASASGDEMVRLWDVTTGKVIRTLEGHADNVSAVAFSPNRYMLASASDDTIVRLWNTTTGKVMHTLDGHDSVSAIAFSSDGKVLASASHGAIVRLWNPTTGEAIHTLDGHDDLATAVAFSPDGKMLASASYDHTVRLWDTTPPDVIQALEGVHDSWVKAVQFSPNGQLLASMADNTVRLWNTTTGELQKLEGHDDQVTAIVFSPNGQLLASTSYDSTARIWDVSKGKVIHTLEGHDTERLETRGISGDLDDIVSTIAFSPDGNLLARASDDEIVRLYNVTTGEVTQKFEGHDDELTTVVFSPDGQVLASASYDKTLRVWNSTTGRQICKIKTSNVVKHMVFTNDGQSLTTNIGTISLGLATPLLQVDTSTASMPPSTVSLDGKWLRYMDHEHLWLPQEYRGMCSATYGSVLAIGQSSGMVSIFRMNSTS